MKPNPTVINDRTWRSISSTVTKDFHDEIVQLAEAEGVKVGTLVRRAIQAYCSWQVQGVASSMEVNVEQLIKQSALLFQRVNCGKKENALRDRILRLEIWIDRLFFHLTGRNEMLLVKMRGDVERRMTEFYKEMSRDEKEFRQEAQQKMEKAPQPIVGVTPMSRSQKANPNK